MIKNTTMLSEADWENLNGNDLFVSMLRNKVILEASGRINSKNIVKYAKTNVDMISVGSITNSVNGIDLSLEVS